MSSLPNPYNHRTADLPPHCGNCRFLDWEQERCVCTNSKFISDEQIADYCKELSTSTTSTYTSTLDVDMLYSAIASEWACEAESADYAEVCDLHEPKVVRMKNETYADWLARHRKLEDRDHEEFMTRIKNTLKDIKQ